MGVTAASHRRLTDTGVVGVFLPDTSRWTVEQYQAALEESRKITLYWIQLSAQQNTELRQLDESLPPRVFHPQHPFQPVAARFRAIVKRRAETDAAKVYAGQVIDHLTYMVQNAAGDAPFRSRNDVAAWLQSRKHSTV